MKSVIIVEKSSQARDLRTAIGSRLEEIPPAEGHLIRLAEPDEVNSAWKRWSCDLLKPDGLYPTRAAREKTKSAKLKAIALSLAKRNSMSLPAGFEQSFDECRAFLERQIGSNRRNSEP